MTPLTLADTAGRGCSSSLAPQPSSGVDCSGRDGCGIHEGDGGAEPRATGVLARSLAGPSHCAHSRQWRRGSCATRVAHICENCDVPSSCMSSERAKSCHVRCADERLSVGDGKGAPQMNVERGRAACWPSLEPRLARFQPPAGGRCLRRCPRADPHRQHSPAAAVARDRCGKTTYFSAYLAG